MLQKGDFLNVWWTTGPVCHTHRDGTNHDVPKNYPVKIILHHELSKSYPVKIILHHENYPAPPKLSCKFLSCAQNLSCPKVIPQKLSWPKVIPQKLSCTKVIPQKLSRVLKNYPVKVIQSSMKLNLTKWKNCNKQQIRGNRNHERNRNTFMSNGFILFFSNSLGF